MIFNDDSPTGVGKSYNAIMASAHVEQHYSDSDGRNVYTLHSLPDHGNAIEHADAMRSHGLDAIAWPQRDGLNCENHAEASDAEACGLSARAAVCPGCKFRESCETAGYLSQVAGIQDTPHLVITHRRLELMPSLQSGRYTIFAQEDARNLLKPMTTISLPQLQMLGNQIASLRRAFVNWRNASVADNDDDTLLVDYATLLFDHVDLLTRKLQTTDACTKWESLSDAYGEGDDKRMSGVDRPKLNKWQAAIWRVVRQDRTNFVHFGTFLAAIERIANDESKWFGVQSPSELTAQPSLYVVTQTTFKRGKNVIISDSTMPTDLASQLCGTDVQSITPDGRLEMLKDVIQIPLDVTRSASPNTAAKYLRSLLADLPKNSRIGLISSSQMINSLVRTERGKHRLPANILKRITLTAYDKEEIDRGSNEWLRQCDIIVVLGTPRYPAAAIQAELLRLGDIDSANRDGEWGPRRWEARTPSGDPVIVDGLGYRDVAWRAAARHLTRASLVQHLGRARPYNPEGIPAIIFTTEPIDSTIPVADSAGVERIASRVAEVVWAVRTATANGTVIATTESVGNLLGLRRRQTIDLIARAAEIEPRIVTKSDKTGGVFWC